MGKARCNPGNHYYKLDAMCLDCSTRSIVKRNNFKNGWYQIEDEICPICLKQTKHVICKNLDELKSKLQFELDLTEEEEMILQIMKDKKDKVR